MSKKRSLSGISANTPKSNNDAGDSNIILPVVSMALNGSNSQNESGKSIRGFEYLVNPDDCRPWKYHNRDQIWMSPEKCKDLISSIRKNGQKFPIIARKIENDSDGKVWEIIAGRRRWFACKHIGIQVRLKSIVANDRDCAILMNLENKDRDDLSEFEDAVSYRQQLEAGLFDSQDDMAVALDLNKSKLSKMLNSAKLTNYSYIMKLFDDITLLKINPVYTLVTMLEKSYDNKDVILKKAEKLLKNKNENLKLSPTVIISKLIESVSSSIKTSKALPKYYKLNDKPFIKTQEIRNGKVLIEVTKSVDIRETISEAKKILLEVFEEYV